MMRFKLGKRAVIMLVVAGAAVAICAIGATVALALTGDDWQGSPAIINTDGTLAYAGHVDNVVMYEDRTLSFPLTNLRTSAGPYTVNATGRWFGSQDCRGCEPDNFGYVSTSATIRDAIGKVVCARGTLSGGGDYIASWFLEMTFPKSCGVIPGRQYVWVQLEGDGLGGVTRVARVWPQR